MGETYVIKLQLNLTISSAQKRKTEMAICALAKFLKSFCRFSLVQGIKVSGHFGGVGQLTEKVVRNG